MALEIKDQTTTNGAPLRLDALLGPIFRRAGVSTKERMFFTEQLAMLLGTGVSLHAALQGLKTQTDNEALARLIEQMFSDIAEGKTFSHALSRHPEVFSRTYVNLIAASENGGFMHQVLTQRLEMDEKREQLRATLVSALSYPVFLIVFSLGVVIFVLVVVFPKFGDLFAAIQDQLPVTTVILMAMSGFLMHYWMPLLGACAGAMVAARYWIASPAGTQRLDRLKLGLPGLRDVFIKLYLLQSLRVMSLSLANGVSIVDTLAACAERWWTTPCSNGSSRTWRPGCRRAAASRRGSRRPDSYRRPWNR
jgi:type II secretory pathway component PulF